MVLDNPKAAGKWFSLQQGEQSSRQSHECCNTLYNGAKNYNTVIVFRRVRSYIREVEVKRKQSARFRQADLGHIRINTPTHALIHNRNRIVLMLRKQIANFEG